MSQHDTSKKTDNSSDNPLTSHRTDGGKKLLRIVSASTVPQKFANSSLIPTLKELVLNKLTSRYLAIIDLRVTD